MTSENSVFSMGKALTLKLLQERTLGRSSHLAETNTLLGFYVEHIPMIGRDGHFKILSDLGLGVRDGRNKGELLEGWLSSTHPHFAPKKEEDWAILEKAFLAGIPVKEVTRFDSFDSTVESWAKNARGNHRGW